MRPPSTEQSPAPTGSPSTFPYCALQRPLPPAHARSRPQHGDVRSSPGASGSRPCGAAARRLLRALGGAEGSAGGERFGGGVGPGRGGSRRPHGEGEAAGPAPGLRSGAVRLWLLPVSKCGHRSLEKAPSPVLGSLVSPLALRCLLGTHGDVARSG